MSALLVVDIDGTLCASPPVPNGDDFAAWERMITEEPPPVVEGDTFLLAPGCWW